jgi:DNA-binding GntR family transcriptional regulator
MKTRKPARKAGGVQDIYATLKDEIMWGKIESEVLLSESVLAERFGVSRTPVREALTRLANDGLLTALPRRGHLVRAISLSEVLDAFRVRELLEVEAVSQAVRRIGDEDIARLRTLANTRASPDLPAVNREFHLIIARASGNRILFEFLEKLLVSMQRVLIMAPQTITWVEDVADEELAIVDALVARDETAACEAMRRHIRNAMASVLRQTQQ